MRRKHVTINDDVTDSDEHSAHVDSSVPSIPPTGEASWEQLSDQHGDGHVAVTSAGAGDVTPERDSAGIGRQIPALPNVTTCSAQPRSHTPASMAAPGVNQSLPNTLQVTAHSIPDLTQTTSMYQTLSATASAYTPNMPSAQRLTYDGTPQPLPYDPYVMYMPYGPFGAHYYGQHSICRRDQCRSTIRRLVTQRAAFLTQFRQRSNTLREMHRIKVTYHSSSNRSLHNSQCLLIAMFPIHYQYCSNHLHNNSLRILRQLRTLQITQ